MKFAVDHKRGFHIQFANGVWVSTQFGGGNYCANYDNQIESKKPESCKDAEVAFYADRDGDWLTRQVFEEAGVEWKQDPEDIVAGYIDPDTWLKLISAAAKMDPKS